MTELKPQNGEQLPADSAAFPASAEELDWAPGSTGHTAQWFLYQHRNLVPILYVESLGWHVWNGQLWQPDPENIRVRQTIFRWVTRLHRQTFGKDFNKQYTDKPGYIMIQVYKCRCGAWHLGGRRKKFGRRR